jgi:hypothetical protein
VAERVELPAGHCYLNIDQVGKGGEEGTVQAMADAAAVTDAEAEGKVTLKAGPEVEGGAVGKLRQQLGTVHLRSAVLHGPAVQLESAVQGAWENR